MIQDEPEKCRQEKEAMYTSLLTISTIGDVCQQWQWKMLSLKAQCNSPHPTSIRKWSGKMGNRSTKTP
jgi:hypothetical protein